MVEVHDFYIDSDFITLGQFLKRADYIESGGMAKDFLETYLVLVDGEEEERRGRKLYPGMQVEFPENDIYLIQAEAHGD